MKKMLAIMLVVVSMLLLASVAIADREDRANRFDRHEGCCPPEEEVCPPEEEVCPPIEVCFPEVPEIDVDVCIPKAPCFPEIRVEEFPEINCPEINVEIPEICPPCVSPAPCPEEEECCPDDRHSDRKHR